ncbi:Uncharacterised protein [Mycobacteroides abscessus subsp. abscessus]|nr:Uncharacterised protein [Mycobacteroides abscessus subsp. abscessus]
MITRSPKRLSSLRNGSESRCRPVYTMVHGLPSCSANAIIDRIGVIPMPPATKCSLRGPGWVMASGKALRGPRMDTVAPICSASCTSMEPPPPPGIRRTAMR